jgi:hypothetical protein
VAATHPRQHPRIARPYASIENTKGQPESQRFQLQRAEPDPALTLSAILCGSVACPRRARTLGRGAGGCDCWAMAPSPGFGCAWNTWIYHQEKSAQAPEIPEQKWGKRTQLSGDGTGRDGTGREIGIAVAGYLVRRRGAQARLLHASGGGKHGREESGELGGVPVLQKNTPNTLDERGVIPTESETRGRTPRSGGSSPAWGLRRPRRRRRG